MFTSSVDSVVLNVFFFATRLGQGLGSWNVSVSVSSRSRPETSRAHPCLEHPTPCINPRNPNSTTVAWRTALQQFLIKSPCIKFKYSYFKVFVNATYKVRSTPLDYYPITFAFCLTGQLFRRYSRLGRVPRSELLTVIVAAGHLTNQMFFFFLSPHIYMYDVSLC